MKRPFAVLLFTTMALGTTFAQGPTGALTGKVTDEAGAVMQGVRVSVHGEGKGLIPYDSSITTNDAGEFLFSVPPQQTYRLTAEHQGFSHTTIASIPAPPPVRLDMVMRVGKGFDGDWSSGAVETGGMEFLMKPKEIAELLDKKRLDSLLMVSLFLGRGVPQSTSSIREITRLPDVKGGPKRTRPASDETGKVAAVKVDGTKLRFSTYKTANNVRVETVYEGTLAADDTLELLRLTVAGETLDRKEGGTGKPLVLHRVSTMRQFD